MWNSRINIGHIGVGGQGMAHVSQMKPKHGDNNTQSVAVCDVSKHRQEFAKAKILDGNAGAKVDTYGDYRKLLERKDIDVIVCGTVDHWHTKISVDALNAGKHVYVEKPMTRYLSEAFEIYDAVKKTGIDGPHVLNCSNCIVGERKLVGQRTQSQAGGSR